MSSFNNKGLRKHKLQNKKDTKFHLEKFYAIINDVEKLSEQLDLSLDYTEENINSFVNPLFNRDLDNIEKMLLLGKINSKKQLLNETKNNI